MDGGVEEGEAVDGDADAGLVFDDEFGGAGGSGAKDGESGTHGFGADE